MSTLPGTVDHTGLSCPVCSINGVCGHPVSFPAIPPWVPNVFVKDCQGPRG